MDIGFYGIRKFGRFIRRIIRWLPVLYKQEDWDYDYLYDLIEIKLKELRECLRKDDIHVNSDKYVKQISICLEYLDRYRNWDNYIKLPTKAFWVKEWQINFSDSTRNKYSKKFAKHLTSYADDNYDMFWKRFLQWHRNWWC